MNDQLAWLTNHVHGKEAAVGLAVEFWISEDGAKLITMGSLDQGSLILLQ